jgi:asparagine synthase (glutamine-hydrolysing)
VIQDSSVAIGQYWSLDPSTELSLAEDEYPEAFLGVFSEAVRSRLRSDGKVGASLSGGLDSSSIVGVGRKIMLDGGRDSLSTFSALTERDEDCADSPFVRTVAEMEGLSNISVMPSELDPYRSELEELLFYTEDPFDHHLLVPQLMAILARRHGFSVLLDGIDGDVVTAEDPEALEQLLRAGEWWKALQEARGFAAFYRGNYEPWSSTWGMMYRYGRRALVPGFLRDARQRSGLARRSLELIRQNAVQREFAQRIGLTERLSQYVATRSVSFTGKTKRDLGRRLREKHASDLNHPNVTVALERYHRVSSTYGVEARHPFYDKQLVEFCLSLPWEQKFHRGWSKRLLRQAMSGLVPDEVRWRRDCWSHAQPAFFMALLGLLSDHVEETLASRLWAVEPYVDIPSLQRAYSRHKAKPSHQSAQILWDATSLALWLSRKKPSPVSVAEIQR